MIVNLDLTKNTCQVTKEQKDPRFTSSDWSLAESTFLYHVLKALKAQGHDVIKKRMWKDGNLVDDKQQWIRTRNTKAGGFALYNSAYAIYDLGEEFNKLSIGDSIDVTVEGNL